MASKEETAAVSLKPQTNVRYGVLVLLALITGINYIDRVNFGVATPTLMKEFGLSTGEMGVLMSAFFWSYTLMMIPSGLLLNKFGPKKVLGFAAFAWGLATMATGLCRNTIQFVIVRIALGLTEAPAFPANARVVSVWVPVRERTFSSAVFDTAARAGVAFSPPLVVWLIMQYGWKMSFIVTGALAVAAGVIWLCWYHEPGDHPKVSASELAYIRQDEVLESDGKVKTRPIPMARLLTYPVVLKAAFANFFYVYVVMVFMYWIPTYLVKARGLSLKEMGFMASIPFIFSVVGELIGGKVFDKWYDKGANITRIRRVGMGIGMLGISVFLYMCTQATTPFWAVFWLTVTLTVSAFGTSNIWAIPSDIAPYGQAGAVGGIYNFIGQFGGLLGPMVTGFLAESKYGFNGAFAVCICCGIIGAILFIFNRYERLEPKAADK